MAASGGGVSMMTTQKMLGNKDLNLSNGDTNMMKKKILLKAPILTRSGYGEQSRFALRSLRSREDLFDIYIQPLTWGMTSWLTETSEERLWIDAIIEKTIHHIQTGGQFDISLQVSIPNEWEKIAPINIGYTAGIETTKVAAEWITKGNEMDKIIVVSNHSKNIYEKTSYDVVNEQTKEVVNNLKLETEIEAVNYPVKTYEQLPELEFDLEYDFNFVSVAQWGPRKNIANAIKWFVEEFHDEEVGLVLKTNYAKNSLMDREHVFGQISNHLKTLGPDRKCKIYLLHGDMSDEEMHAIYNHPKVKAAISFTHGEGFGLPLFEAAYMGVPVVAPGWSGQNDFLFDDKNKENFYNVSFDIGPVPQEILWENVIIKESGWAFPRELSAKEQMRRCYDDIHRLSADPNDTKDNIAALAATHAEYLNSNFTEENKYAAFVSAMGAKEDFDVEGWLSNLDIEEIE